MTKIASADIVIFGGGIAGLWLLNRLRNTGFSTILFESNSLGGGQTYKSQGIIHGGLKYALQGILTSEATTMMDMPSRWRDCLQGKGEINLSEVPILSSCQYLWSPSKFTSKLTGFLASTALSSKVGSLNKADYPAIFKSPGFKGEVFSLDEMVIDVPVLVRELIKDNQDAIFKIEPLCDEELRFSEDNQLKTATVYLAGKAVEVTAQQFIFTAGSGNELIINKLKNRELAMQRRPLHMVMMKTPFNFPLYAHCLGLGPRPRITITTHYTLDGHPVWYLGGQLAEDGIELDSAAQIKIARNELQNLFPWLDFKLAEFATFIVDRAEPKQKTGFKPDTSYLKAIENMIIAWPTKLALAPKLADEILLQIEKANLSPKLLDIRELRAWPMPPLARPVWEEAFCKSVA